VRHAWREHVSAFRQNARQIGAQKSEPLPYRDATLQQKRADLVYDADALADQSLADAMECLSIPITAIVLLSFCGMACSLRWQPPPTSSQRGWSTAGPSHYRNVGSSRFSQRKNNSSSPHRWAAADVASMKRYRRWGNAGTNKYCRQRLRREPSAARRQRHKFHPDC